ncbi:MAG: ABC transporter ATP-binding protein/permease [Bacteroidales bacterium]|nr:ABC transporter ATP-binding protein/permease [Bacteroidales bacterium]
MNNRKRFLTLIKPYKGKLALVVITNTFAVIFSIAVMMLIEPFVKLIFKGETSNLSPIGNKLMEIASFFVDTNQNSYSLLAIIVFVITLFILKNGFSFFAQCLMAPVRSDFVRTLRNNLYDKVLRLPLAYFSEQRKGDVISRAVNDAQEIEFTMLNALKQMLTQPITVVFYLVALLILNYKLTLFALLLLPALLLIGKLSRKLKRQSLEAKTKLGILFSHLEESLLGLRIIKGFNAQAHAEDVFDRQNTEYSDLMTRIHRRTDIASPISEFLGITLVMIVLVVGGLIVIRGDSTLTAELFIAYIAIFTQIINPGKEIATANSNFKRGLSTMDRIYEILDVDEVINDKENALNIQSFEQNIELRNVSFSYGEKKVLNNMNGLINKGEIIALVGPSGAGKSTLTDLLPRFYDTTEGAILVDGHDIRDYVINDLRSLYSIVSQDIVLFNDTIFSNIAFGKKEVTQEAVIEAAKTANAYDFIMSLPEGFDTNIGDRGLNLSGGQRQRISIARAVLRNAPILILDEATSAMDTESEQLVQNALDKVMKDRTSIVVAHRLSTIQNADCIWVIENGEIIERGTHTQLLAMNGKYSRLLHTAK